MPPCRSYAFSPDGSEVYMLTSAAPDEDRDAEAEDGFNAVVYEEEFDFNRMFVASVQMDAAMDAEPREIERARLCQQLRSRPQRRDRDDRFRAHAAG